MAKVITYGNFKGGTGKTTNSGMMAYMLSKLGYKTLLADLDPHMLFLLSLKTAIVLASDNKFLGIAVTDVVLESVIERSWRAIQK